MSSPSALVRCRPVSLWESRERSASRIEISGTSAAAACVRCRVRGCWMWPGRGGRQALDDHLLAKVVAAPAGPAAAQVKRAPVCSV